MAKDLNISVLLDFYGQMLTEKQYEAVELYYNNDLSLAEIAEHSKITRQGIRDSIKRAELQLKEYEERLGLAGRFKEIHAGLDEIALCCKEIELINEKFGGSKDIYSRLTRIGEIADRLGE